MNTATMFYHLFKSGIFKGIDMKPDQKKQERIESLKCGCSVSRLGRHKWLTVGYCPTHRKAHAARIKAWRATAFHIGPKIAS